MTKPNKKALSAKTGIQNEVINLLGTKPHTHRQLCDALILPGEPTRPILDATYRLISNGIAIKGEDGYIRLITQPAQPEVAQNTGSQPSDENSAGGVMASGFSRAEGPTESPPEVETPLGEEANDDLPDILPEVQALKDENLALRLAMDGLKAELGDALVSANDYAGQTETLRQLNQNMDAVFVRLHQAFDEAGAPTGDLEMRVNDLIKFLYERPVHQPIHGYIVTDLHQIHDTEQEAVDFASAEARPDSTILIAAVVRRGTVPPIAVQWINPQQAEVSHV